MRIQYTIKRNEQELPTRQITLSINGVHLGSIWGEVYKDEDDKFEQKHNVVHINNNSNRIATLWDAEEIV